MSKSIADLEREFYIQELTPEAPEELTNADLKKQYLESKVEA